jgi:hypothetical protein
VFGSASCPGCACWHDTEFQTLNRRWPALSPAQIAQSSVPVTLATWSPPGPPGGPFLPVTVAAFASSQPCWPPWRSGPLPGAALANQGRAFASGRRGARAQRVVPMVSVRRCARLVRCAAQAQGCAVAQPDAPVGVQVVRQVRNQVRRGARDLAGCQPPSAPVGALALPMPGPGRRWLVGGVPLRGSRRAGASS